VRRVSGEGSYSTRSPYKVITAVAGQLFKGLSRLEKGEFVEHIPDTVKVPVKKRMPGGKATIQEITFDLSAEDLAVAATFESRYTQLEVILVNAKHTNLGDGHFEKIEGTEVKIRFKGGKWRTRNTNLVRMLMATTVYPADVYADPEDETGFWRQLGMVEVETVPVVKRVNVKFPHFDELNFKVLKLPEEDETVQPIAKIA